MLCALPVEIASRELLGMLYLSLKLAQKGLPSLVGERMVDRYVRSTKSPICYFDSDQHKETNEHVLVNGGVVLNINPEGLSLLENPESAARNFGAVADYATKICMWGEEQKRLMEKLLPADKHDMLTVTGYPSFDLLNERFVPMYRNQSIIDRYGEGFILFNTSFGFYNHEMGVENYLKMLTKMKEWQLYATEEYKAFIKETCDYQKQIITETVAMIRHLANVFPEKTIIVRPHPAENKNFYETAFKGMGNIVVTNENEVRPWLASASVVIHHDCTTGMEAMMLGKPVIQYRPVFNEKVTSVVMTRIGLKTYSPEEVENVIREVDDMPKGLTDEYREHLAPILGNISMNASGRLADLARESIRNESTWLPQPLDLVDQAKCWRKHISKLIRQYQPGRNGRKVKYALNKFPRIRRDEIVTKIEELRKVERCLPKVSIEQLCLNTFLIKPM